MHQPKDTDWLGSHHVHARIPTYNLSWLDPPQIVCNYFMKVKVKSLSRV